MVRAGRDRLQGKGGILAAFSRQPTALLSCSKPAQCLNSVSRQGWSETTNAANVRQSEALMNPDKGLSRFHDERPLWRHHNFPTLPRARLSIRQPTTFSHHHVIAAEFMCWRRRLFTRERSVGARSWARQVFSWRFLQNRPRGMPQQIQAAENGGLRRASQGCGLEDD